MTDKEIDNLFQQSFAAHQMPVPDAVWKKVNPQRRKKRRALLGWQTGLCLAFLLLASALAWWAIMNAPVKPTTTKTAAAAQHSEAQLHSEKAKKAGHSDAADAVMIHKNSKASQAAAVSLPKNVTQKNAFATNKKEAEHEPHYSFLVKKKSAVVNGRAAEIHLPKNPTLTAAEAGNQNREVTKITETNSNADTKTTVTATAISNGNNEGIKTTNANRNDDNKVINSTNANRNAKVETRVNTNADSHATNEVTADINSTNKDTDKQTATTLPLNDSAALAQTGNTALPDSAAAAKAASVLLHLSRQRPVSMEWMVAGFAGNRAIYNVKKQEPQFSVSQNKPNVDDVVRSLGVSVRIEKPLSRHWLVKSGLQFLQTYQSIAYNTQTINQSAVVNAFSPAADTTRFIQISVQRRAIKSVVNSFAVPLLFTWHTAGKKWNFGASGGVVLNLLSWYGGEVPDGDYRKRLKAANLFRRNSGSWLYLGLPVAKRWGNWQLSAEPQFQHSLRSLTKSGVGFRQRMTYYGLGIGLKKRLGK